MLTIRHSTFETNSSSIHSLVIDNSGMEPSNLTIKNGEVIVPLQEFGKEGFYNTQEDKLSYLLTRIYLYCNGKLDESYVFEYLEEAILDYVNKNEQVAGKIKAIETDYADIDHQSYPEYSDDMNGFCNIYSAESVQNFVFNKYIAFTCGVD